MQKLAITNASKLRCVEGPHSANTNPIMGDKFQNRNKKKIASHRKKRRGKKTKAFAFCFSEQWRYKTVNARILIDYRQLNSQHCKIRATNKNVRFHSGKM